MPGKEGGAASQPASLARPPDASKLKKHITLVCDRLHKGMRPKGSAPSDQAAYSDQAQSDQASDQAPGRALGGSPVSTVVSPTADASQSL